MVGQQFIREDCYFIITSTFVRVQEVDACRTSRWTHSEDGKQRKTERKIEGTEVEKACRSDG